jgi:hypothetical protein
VALLHLNGARAQATASRSFLSLCALLTIVSAGCKHPTPPPPGDAAALAVPNDRMAQGKGEFDFATLGIPLEGGHFGILLKGQRYVGANPQGMRRARDESAPPFARVFALDHGFLFVTEKDAAAAATYFAEHFDGPTSKVGDGRPCVGPQQGGSPLCSHQRTTKAGSSDAELYDPSPSVRGLALLWLGEASAPMLVKLPGNDLAPPPGNELGALAWHRSGIGFALNERGAWLIEPDAKQWRLIGAGGNQRLTIHDYVALTVNDKDPMQIVARSDEDVRRKLPLVTRIGFPVSTSEVAYGRFSSMEVVTDNASINVTRQTIHATTKVMPLAAGLPLFLSQVQKHPGDTSNTSEHDKVLRLEQPPRAPAKESDPARRTYQAETELRLADVEPANFRGTRNGILLQNRLCDGERILGATCVRAVTGANGPEWISRKAGSEAREMVVNLGLTDENPPALFLLQDQEILAVGVARDGRVGLAKAGKLRVFSKDGLPVAVPLDGPLPELNAGEQLPSLGDKTPFKLAALHSSHIVPHEEQPALVSRDTPQMYLSPKNGIRIFPLTKPASKLRYFLELGFDTQPELDTFLGEVAMFGPYGLGIMPDGTLHETLTAGASWKRVPGLPRDALASLLDLSPGGIPGRDHPFVCRADGCWIGALFRSGYGSGEATMQRKALAPGLTTVIVFPKASPHGLREKD